MKSHLKVISLILTLVLVLGSFSGAFAEDNGAGSLPVLSDIAGLSGQEQIQVCQALGIVTGNPDGTYQPEKLLNRAEFAAMIVRALGIHSSALEEYIHSPFLDTDGYGWAVKYLAYCQARGIMLGDGAGNAMPGRTITVNEAITMILRAIGYTDNASELSGTWPSNYVSLGKGLGLYDDLKDEVTINKENAAIAIYNALTVQMVKIDAYRATTPLWQTTGIPMVFLNSGLGCEAEPDTVLGKDYVYDNSLFNIAGKIGSVGTGYVNDDGDLVAFAADTEILSGKISGDTFKTAEKTYSFSQTSAQQLWNNFFTKVNVFRNGDCLTNLPAPTATLLSGAAAKMLEDLAKKNADGKQLVLTAKVSGGNIKEICSVIFWSASDAELAEKDSLQGIVEDQTLMDLDFATKPNNQLDYQSFELVGITQLSDLAEGNVLYAYADSDGIVRKLAVGASVAEGELTSVGTSYFSVKNKPYSYACGKDGFLLIGTGGAIGFDNNDIVDEIGADVMVRLDAYGYGFDIEASGGYQGNIAVPLSTSGEGFDYAKLKLYNADDGQKTFKLMWYEDLKVRPWDDKTTPIDTSTVAKLNAFLPGLEPVTSGQNILPNGLVGYKTDKDGVITELDMGLTNGAISVMSATLLKYTEAGTTNMCTIAEEATVYSYETKSGELEIKSESLDNINFKDAKTATYGAIFMNKANTKVIGILLPAAYMTAGEDDVYAVVNNVSDIHDAQRIKGFADGAALSIDTVDKNGISFDATKIRLYILSKNGTDKVRSASEYTVYADGAVSAGRTVAQDGVSKSELWIKTTVQGYIIVAEEAVIYKAVLKDGKWSYETSNLGAIKDNATVFAYDTKEPKDRDGSATIVIWYE